MPVIEARYDAAAKRWDLIKEDGVSKYTDAQIAVIEREVDEALGARRLLARLQAMDQPSLAGLVTIVTGPTGQAQRFETGTSRRITATEWQVLTDEATALRTARGLPL